MLRRLMNKTVEFMIGVLVLLGGMAIGWTICYVGLSLIGCL